ncbi:MULTISPECIES: Lrp/AsnC family transcriptional regulator [unclassified Streptomyces]|uniref:Lrp/AsnC family transcriptional regulator n=1 Tax=unclassified Streptomyces TaxID=2593676 RepID=UPI0011B9347C|nr:Lrp/AsnC family transcriptional regulator [Streptomyces sp. PsTaAH-137]MYT72480.1 AsnC family transcriptional regulator [Streptomyces sp. SID8367]
MSELDLSLVHALQVHPRAAWTDLEPLLGASAVTLARRWERLTAQGLAWISAVPGPSFSRSGCTAFVFLRCAPAARRLLADRVARLREAVTVELLAPGHADLMLDVLTPDLAGMHRFVNEELALLPDVLDVECVFASSLYAEGSRWRLGSLDPYQLSALGRSETPDTMNRSAFDLSPLDHALLDALVQDGRTRLTDLSALTGRSTATVRRRLGRLTASGVVALRCDMAPVVSGLPVSITFRGHAAANDVNRLHRTLATLPECRLLAAVTGSANVLATYWVRDIGSVQQRETAACAQSPSLTVTDRVLGVRTVKRMGHLLDDEGRRVGVCPIRPW